jgi:cytoskeletal protein CcmA (bactofilin family)
MWKKSESDTPSQSSSSDSQSTGYFPAQEPNPQSGDRSVIGSSISIKGDISGDENLLIEGEIEGEIAFHNHNVTIGQNGRIKADIHGKTIAIDGNHEGNLFATEQLIIRQTGTVHGNIVSPRVVLEDGCNFKGNIDMSPKEKASPSTPLIVSDDTDDEIL